MIRIYTIYCDPRDHPGKWVLRGCSVGPGVTHDAMPICVADSLEEARANVPPQADCNMGRHVADDPVIHEVWI